MEPRILGVPAFLTGAAFVDFVQTSALLHKGERITVFVSDLPVLEAFDQVQGDDGRVADKVRLRLGLRLKREAAGHVVQPVPDFMERDQGEFGFAQVRIKLDDIATVLDLVRAWSVRRHRRVNHGDVLVRAKILKNIKG